jgi:glycosyltransferase involved in cell wall biosynthesis
MNIKLSFCIPTFNRPLALKNTLHMLCKEIEGLESQVEICVSDNASPPEIQKLVNDFIKVKPNIHLKYQRNNSNLGYDKNCEMAIRMGSGQYLWFIGDDDRLKQGAVSKVILQLDADKPDLAFINYKIVVDRQDLPSAATDLSIKTDKSSKIFEKINLANTFLSSCIFSSEALKKTDLRQPNGTFWYHFFLFYQVIEEKPNARVLYYGYPLIIQTGLTIEATRLEKSYEYEGPLEFYIDAYFSFLKRVNEKQIFSELNLIWMFEILLVRQILYYRIGNAHQNLLVKIRISNFVWLYSFKKKDKIAALLILILPRKLLKFALKIRKAIYD